MRKKIIVHTSYRPMQGVLFEDFDIVQQTKSLIAQHSFLTGSENEATRRKMMLNNWHLSKGMRLTDKSELPIVAPYNGNLPRQLSRFNEISHKRYSTCLHFFQDDYTFSCLWRKLEYYTLKIANFKYVIAPDYSLYVNVSKQLNMQSLYFNQFISAFWQNVGINVIPTVSWGNADSFEYCLEGKPKHSVLAVSAVGMNKSKARIELFKFGISKVIDILQPTMLLVYGNSLIFDNQGIPTLYYKDFINSKFRK